MADAYEDDLLEYDGDSRQLIATNRISPTEMGASAIVAENVLPWFGTWAVLVWNEEATVPVVTNVGPDQQDQAHDLAREHARKVAHTATNDPAGLYDDDWEPKHD